jgi:hypothetical protein
LDIYERQLLAAGVLTAAQRDAMTRDVWAEYEAELDAQRGYAAHRARPLPHASPSPVVFDPGGRYQPDPLEWLSSNWQGAALGR